MFAPGREVGQRWGFDQQFYVVPGDFNPWIMNLVLTAQKRIDGLVSYKDGDFDHSLAYMGGDFYWKFSKKIKIHTHARPSPPGANNWQTHKCYWGSPSSRPQKMQGPYNFISFIDMTLIFHTDILGQNLCQGPLWPWCDLCDLLKKVIIRNLWMLLTLKAL